MAPARRIVDDYLFKLIAARRAQPRETGDLVTALISAGLNDDLIRDQLLTLLIAGHDTGTALLSWAMYELSRHPAVQARAAAEVRSAAGPQLRTADTLRGLAYLDAVIKETLRRHPPIDICNRLILRDLEFDGYGCRPGGGLLFSIYLTQNDPTHWPEPRRFDPQRFLVTNAAARPALSYLPFGAGARVCVGAAFAQLEARAIPAYLLLRFEFTATNAPVSEAMGATLMPRPAMRVFLRFEACRLRL